LIRRERLKKFVSLIGAILVGGGGIWCGQGAGYISGSFMTGDRHWLIIGAATVCVGIALLIWANVREPDA
jgi:hypothetical protein